MAGPPTLGIKRANLVHIIADSWRLIPGMISKFYSMTRRKATTSKKIARKEGRAALGGSALGRAIDVAKENRGLITSALDAAAMLPIPGAAAVRNGIRAVTGFNERNVLKGAGAAGGGTVVQTMNAPVAFARNNRVPFYKVGKPSSKGIVPFHAQSLVGTISSVATTFTLTTPIPFSPGVSGLFPANFQKAATYSKWRPTVGRLHFVHFAPTSQQGAVFLSYIAQEDPTVAALYATTSAQLMAGEYSVMGSMYEDFSLEFVDARWNPSTWFTVANTDNSASDDPINPGCVTWGVEQGVGTNAIGYIFCEIMGYLCDERTYYAGAGVAADLDMIRMNTKLAASAKKELLERGLQALRDDLFGRPNPVRLSNWRNARPTPEDPLPVTVYPNPNPPPPPPPGPSAFFSGGKPLPCACITCATTGS
jgi:hypothetical protein